ncbi:MAG TPA: hypothetical protein VFX15_13680, partial [Actinomycetes bacterium]|nr:hypothetical protein [Actinomycetes bacterium]
MGGGGGGFERADPSDDDLIAQADWRVSDDDATAERLLVEQATTPWSSLLRGATAPVDLTLDDGTNVVGEVQELGRT